MLAVAGQLRALGDASFLRLQADLHATFGHSQGNQSDHMIDDLLTQLNMFTTSYGMFAAALLLDDTAETIQMLISDHQHSFEKTTVLRALYPGCQLPANLSRGDWPLGLTEVNALDAIRQHDNFPVPENPHDRPYFAYYLWCQPSMCSKITKKGPYLRTMQGVTVFGAVWSIMTLAILILWQCLFLGCVLVQQKHAKPALGGVSLAGGGGGGSGGAATPPDASVSVEPGPQSMDRQPVADKV